MSQFARIGALLGATALLLVTSIAIARPVSAATPFTDISTSTFKADIDWLYNEGTTSGCTPTLYCPKDSVTRGQMASFLARMFDLPATSTDYFTDDDGTTHENNINRVRAAGITTGCSVGQYCPNDTVTRGQMASFIVRAADYVTGAGRNYFYDDNGTTHEGNIDRAAAAGVASGCGTWRYCPTGPVTREQMAGFLHRVVNPITPPPYPAPPPPTPTPTPKPSGTPKPTATPKPQCDPSYPTVCIPPPPPDLDCPDVPYTNFKVVPPDPHNFDGDHDGIGCID